MTAEIAVFNKSAVALAADSAVTISGEDGVSKIYNGADKLFALSKHHPVGVMIFGSADLCGIPWEMIIKQFRKNLTDRSHDTIEKYAEEFFQFLCTSENIIPSDVRENNLLDIYNNRFFPAFINMVEEKRIKPLIDQFGQKPSTLDTYKIIEEEANSMLIDLASEPFFVGFSEHDIEEIIRFVFPIAKDTCDEKLFQEPEVEIPQSLYQVIGALFATITCKRSNFGRNTGVVFAGYGDEEFMPAVLAYDVLGFFRSKLRFSPNLEKSSSGGLCGVKAYAQEEEVETFLHGISNSLKEFILYGFEYECDRIRENISEELASLTLSNEEKKAFEDTIIQKMESRKDIYRKVINNQITDKYSSKVTQMIEFLPKQDLAYMAESLVNLTAFKRKVSNDNETVGGPIDVAIISKGDGFIWVKRKHYFDKDLNHHFFLK
ncbi:hypothetical protein ACR71O_24975 [Klebsiella pneumoniae]|uniref:hypothetical protein n=1 Tax=Klebsiella pneumoniae complex TaxID=3390273 RepID=UPI001141B564|nr:MULTISPECIES: hypothetical protein [Klebsiella]HDS2495393.1 hypothetical protein [Klebsiella pneumoniae subsp. pneumoniae]MCJ8540116.1 hypothetical protein [Klebsiella variicola]TYX80559.1 hypothetical protein FCG84_012535 [Klebsiella pneumoniae]CAF2239538.1 hypothetical protein AI2803V1_2561 [Klebsiella pneumoniae]CAH5009662.1 hypothetical protein AI2803V1_2561 [Klebsiella pneumoniae]